jgi:hypothetical protein
LLSKLRTKEGKNGRIIKKGKVEKWQKIGRNFGGYKTIFTVFKWANLRRNKLFHTKLLKKKKYCDYSKNGQNFPPFGHNFYFGQCGAIEKEI